MEYRSIHYWRYEPELHENVILEEAIALIEDKHRETLLSDLASFILKHTGAKYIIIALLSDDQKQAHTCAFLKDEIILPNITYTLKGTPCHEVVTQRFCYYPLNVVQFFPNDEEIRKQCIESYLGSILLSRDNEPLGLIALMDEKPLANVAFAEHLILVLSPAIEEILAQLKTQTVLA